MILLCPYAKLYVDELISAGDDKEACFSIHSPADDEGE